MNRLVLIATSSLALALASCGSPRSPASLKEAWDAANAPIRISSAFEAHFSSLPKSGVMPTKPWSDSYWPSKQGGIANRWFGSGRSDNAFTYSSPSEDELRTMSRDARMRLSPAEKYDAFVGRFDYPTVKSERTRTSPFAASWEGICHGWVAASLLFAEPAAAEVRSASGISIPFGSSDVKALLSYYLGTVKYNQVARMLGARCNADLTERPEEAGTPECRDTNAGAFHIVLANMLGLQHRGLAIDVTRGREVWNQPVMSYTATVLGEQSPSPGAAVGTVREVNLLTQVHYALEVYPHWDPVLGTPNQLEKTVAYRYRVELGEDGRILGGEWLQSDRPDFIWVPSAVGFDGYWASLQQIYRVVQ